MDEHTLRVLEFEKIILELQEQTACALGREVASLTYPTKDLEAALKKQQETTEARNIIIYEGNIPFGGIEDIRQYLERASVGSILQPTELLSVLSTLQGTRKLGQFLVKLKEKYPIIGTLASDIEFFDELENEISAAISKNGEVLDSASPALARVRSDLRVTQSRLIEKLNSYIQSSQYRAMVQEPIVTLRADRYCIPIKSDYRGQFPGIVHDASASGATLFIEPAALVEIGNQRRELIAKEREEVEKVLARLSSLVESLSDRVNATLNIAGMLDCITARAKLAEKYNATEPVLNNNGIVDIRAGRHPLLKGNVVPIDIELGKQFNALLITGPNTGGKTVSLKTIGLFALMAASGLHIPAKTGSEVAIFEDIYADIGDEQSIEQSLSTFSAHMRNIVNITQKASSNSLVLLDEIGAGTDPGEGAALAKAILDYLLQKGAKIVATTHYGELKEYAYLRDGIENASVEFDIETLQPTYKLRIGIPGSSNAFAIANKLGLDNTIIENAKENLATHSEVTEELIRRIEESHKAAAEQRKIAEKSSEDARILRERYEEQLRRIEDLRSRVESNIRKQAESLIDAYSKRLDSTLEQLAAQQKDSIRAQNLKKKVEKILDQFEQETVAKIAPDYEKEEPIEQTGNLCQGSRVRIAGVDKDGVIVEPPEDGRVTVMIGTMKVTVPLSSLRKAKENAPEKYNNKQRVEETISFEKARNFVPEIHLRGQRVEPALIELDKYIDDAIAAGVEQVRIVHGKGTGVMRQAVAQYLKSHKGISSFRLGEQGEGGHGVTIAYIKR